MSKKTTISIVTILVLFVANEAQAAVIDGFDYPFGPPDGTPRCPGTAQCSGGWQNVQDFGENNHLGEDWNFGFGSDDLGMPVYAVANGVVEYAQDVGGDGSWKGVIIIRHSGSNLQVPGGEPVSQVKSMYAHLDVSKINNWVSVGSVVWRGQQIGVIGPTPTGSTGPHLHFEMRTNPDILVGPGYSANSAGWVDPSNFIDRNRSASPLKFSVGDTVEVFNTGGIGLKAWTDTCTGTWVNKPDGTTGVIQGGPVECGGYMRWRIRYSGDSIDCWSAEDWLRKVSSPQTLSVSLSANPSSGTAPLNGVDLTATVSGTATGTINYTFYANRSDDGTNITPDYCFKINDRNPDGTGGTVIYQGSATGWTGGTTFTVYDVYNYTSPGTYTAKVIAERGSCQAESRFTITANPSNSSPTLTSGYVSPDSGDTSTDFYYYVNYYDADGDSPTMKDVYIDGTPHTMTLYSGSASNGTYYYETTLPVGGEHSYYFYFEDGKGGTAWWPSPTSCQVGPTVNKTRTGKIVAWGENDYGECNVPSPNTGFIAIAAGGSHGLGLKANGSIIAWGDNGWHQCDVPSPNTGFIATAAGLWHSLAIKQDGSIVAWGRNDESECNIPSPNAGFVAIAAGAGHSLGLKQDGSIVAWGYNGYGQCDIPSPNSDFIAIAAGADNSLGLKKDGYIVIWGWGGQSNVPSPNSGFIAIAAGFWHGLAIKQDGSIVTWGGCGVGSGPSPNSDFVAVAGGSCYSLGLKNDGSIVGWGFNDSGQCDVPSPNTGFVAIATGTRYSLGLKAKIPADIDIDGDVDFADYAIFAYNWMDDTCCAPDWCEGTDFDHSGGVDMLDLATFARYWLEGI